MIKKWLTKAADRGFRLVGAMLMRRAIARLVSIDDTSLSKSGLSRAAVAEFLTTPAHTDPHRFFTRRHAQTGMHRDAAEFDTCLSATVAKQTPGTSALPGLIRRHLGLRLRVVTAALLLGFGALSACSGTVPERGSITTHREPSPQCRLRPHSLPLAPLTAPSRHRAARAMATAIDEQRTASLQHARDGPIDRAV